MRLRIIIYITLLFWLNGQAQEGLFPIQVAPTNLDAHYPINRAMPFDVNSDGTIEILYALPNGISVRYQNPQDPTEYLEPVPYGELPFIFGQFTGIVDVDNDGFQDIVTTNGGELGWLKNDGTAFTEFHQMSMGGTQTTAYIHHADIDQDGDVDISGFTGWYENANGLGTDWIYHSFDVGLSHYKLVDINGDSFPDWVSWDPGDEDIIAYINDGTGTWPGPTTLASNLGSIGQENVVIDDFDGDGDIDIIVSLPTFLKLIRNTDGLGTYEVESLPAFATASIYSADVDNDGDIDLIEKTFSSSRLKLEYFLNTGNGSFSTQGNVLTEEFFHGFNFQDAPIDMDQDGDLDFFIKDLNFDSQLMWLETQNQGFAIHIIETNPDEAQTLIYDLDEDGFEDILVLNYFNYQAEGHLYWYRNVDGKGTFYNPKMLLHDDEFGEISKADLDGDGYDDLLLKKTETRLYWFRKRPGIPAFEEKREIDYYLDTDIRITGDFDEDGKIDIIGEHGFPSEFTLLSNFDSLGNFSISIIGDITTDIASITAADVNGDQHLDLVCSPIGAATYWLPNDGTGVFGSPITFAGAPLGDYKITAADLDADGDPDFVVHDIFEIYWLENLDGGTSLDIHLLHDDLDLAGIQVETFDINADGDIDIVPLRGDHELVYFENRNNSQFKAVDLGVVDYGNSFKDGDIGDINSDGTPDIVTSANHHGIQVYLNFFGFPSITGKCFFDENENGSLDSNEIGLPAFQLETSPNDLISYSSNDGECSFFFFNGIHTLSSRSNPNWQLTTTPESYEVSISDTSATNPYLFGFSPIEEILSTDILVHSGPTRCGFDVNFQITNSNNGTLINDGFVLFILDSLVEFNYASPAPDSMDGLWLYWNFEDMYPSQTEQIVVNATIPGVDFLGETLRFSATSNVLNEFGQIIFSEGFRYEPVVNCSYDPNDKLIYPDPPGEENFTFPNDTILYTVRFQNTGTDTAFTVRIIDQLDDNLDWNTCQPVASSHPFQLFRSSTGELEFLFEDILLPDSNVNEVASHGFISFRAQLENGLEDFTVIENTAEIYFDFNPAIITNTIQNTIVTFLPQLEISQESVSCFGDSSGVVSVSAIGFPPFQYAWTNEDNTAIIDSLPAGIYSVTVTDNEGHTNNISTEITEPTEITFTISSTPSVDNNNDGTASIIVDGGTPSYSYEWSSIPPQYTGQATGLAPENYFVTVTDANGCTIVTDVKVDAETTISTNELNDNILSIYPNPTKGKTGIQITIDSPEEVIIEIHDQYGQIILSEQKPKASRFSINKVGISSGVYWVRVFLKNQWIVKRVVVLE